MQITQDKMQITHHITFYVTIMIVSFLVLAGYTNGQSILVPPSDTTGLVGANAQLSCEVNFGAVQDMKWEHNGAYIYSLIHGVEDYPVGRDKYEFTRSGSTFHLEIKMLTLKDSGIFTCHNFVNTADAVLIVLDNPVSHVDPQDPEDGDSTTLTCDASFGGPNKELISPEHFPKLEMHYEGKKIAAAEINDDKNPYDLHKVYNLTVKAGMDGDGITCMIGTTHPDFNATTSSKLKVLYSVRNITYTPQLKQYEVGSNITCTAQGNPTPHMEWDDVAGKTFLGNQLLITQTMVGPNKWKCTARNIIRGRMHMESMTAEFAVVKDYGSTTDPVDAIPENENNSYWIIWLILGIVGLVLAVGIGALLFVKKRKNQIKNSKEMMTEEQTHHMEAQDDDSGVDDNMENGSHDAQAELPPSKYVEVNKYQESM